MTDDEAIEQIWRHYHELWATYHSTPSWRILLRRRRLQAVEDAFHQLRTRGHR